MSFDKCMNWLAAPACAMLVLCGCSKQSPWHQPRGGTIAVNGQQRHVTLPSQQSVPAQLAAAGSTSVANTSRSIGNSVSSTFRSVGNTVSDTLTVDPKVVPADDPVRLSSKPGRVTAEIFLRTAYMAERSGDLESARRQYEQAIDAEPGQAAPLVALARFEDRQGRAEAALQLYRRAQTIDPSSSLVWNDLGLFHGRRLEMPQSVAALQRAVALQPDNARYRNNLAGMLVQAGDPAAAVEQLAVNNRPAVAWQQVGILLYQRGDLAGSTEYLRTAVQMDPSLIAARRTLAHLESLAPRQPAQSASPSVAARKLPPVN